MLSDDQIDEFRIVLQGQYKETLEAIATAEATDPGVVTVDQARVGRLSRVDALQ